MVTRKLTAADSDALNALIDLTESNLAHPDWWLPINALSRDNFFNDDWTYFLGLFDGDVLVGASALFFNPHEFGESLEHLNHALGDADKVGESVAEIGRCMVAPAYRGKNHLLSLNRQLIDVARSKGIKLLIATIHPDNTPSLKSFQRLGLSPRTQYTKANNFTRCIYTLEL